MGETEDLFKHIVVAVDYTSKWVEARAIKDKTATTVAQFIWEDIICRHGCAKIVITNQGREFNNSIVKLLFELTGTEQRVTTAYHPQSNGLVEVNNK